MKRIAKQVIRQIDETGRVVIPKPFREILGIKFKDNLLIMLGNDEIIIKCADKACAFCGEKGLYLFKGVPICHNCAESIAEGLNEVNR